MVHFRLKFNLAVWMIFLKLLYKIRNHREYNAEEEPYLDISTHRASHADHFVLAIFQHLDSRFRIRKQRMPKLGQVNPLIGTPDKKRRFQFGFQLADCITQT